MHAPTIVSDPRVMMGRPVVTGTRITVERIFDKLAAEESVEQVLGSHRRLTREAVLAAFDFTSALRPDRDL